jgi:hypothetical protein
MKDVQLVLPGYGEGDDEVGLPESPAGQHDVARVDRRYAARHACPHDNVTFRP